MSASQCIRTLTGLVIAAIGVTVMLGWVLQYRSLVAFSSGTITMVFNTAVCFTLIGIATLFSTLAPRTFPAIQTVVGGILILLGGAILVEFLFDTSVGIDWPTLHGWLKNGNRLPGRMAPNAALGFVGTGLVLILLRSVATRWQAWVVVSLTFGILGIGITGLIVFKLNPDLLFGWASSERMAVPTAIGFVLIGLDCWMQWQGAEWYDKGVNFRSDDKILFMAAAILTVVTVTAGLSGFSLQQSTLEHLLQQMLSSNLNARVAAFQRGVDEAGNAAVAASKRADVIAWARQLARDGKVDGPRSGLRHADLIGQLGVVGLELRDPAHRVLMRLGPATRASHILANMPTPAPASLQWQNELILETVTPLTDNGAQLGELVLRRSLSGLFSALVNVSDLGASGEVLVCGNSGSSLLCLPSRREPHVSLHTHLDNFGNPLPMALAASDRAGAAATIDYLGHNVNAAFRPLVPGLGIAIKQDAAEMYAPIRQHLVIVSIILLLLVMLAVAVLRQQIRPLVRRLIDSEMAASEKELQISTMFASVGEGIVTVCIDGNIESSNPAACRIFGMQLEQVMGKPLRQLIPAFVRNDRGNAVWIGIDEQEHQILNDKNVELTGNRLDGSTFPLELTVSAMSVRGRNAYVAIVRDITSRKEAECKLNQLARFDVLTGLPNRAHFMERLAEALVRARRHGKPLALMFLDLDGFKQINDTLGHKCGDEMLQQFAVRLTAVVRRSDTVARLAGDEFTIIMEDVVDGENDALGIARKILSAMERPFVLGTAERSVSTSIGLAVHAEGETTLEALLHRADTAMYEAKRGGKNQVRVGVDIVDRQ